MFPAFFLALDGLGGWIWGPPVLWKSKVSEQLCTVLHYSLEEESKSLQNFVFILRDDIEDWSILSIKELRSQNKRNILSQVIKKYKNQSKTSLFFKDQNVTMVTSYYWKKIIITWGSEVSNNSGLLPLTFALHFLR